MQCPDSIYNHPVYRFLRGEGPDSCNRSLDEILKWDSSKKEKTHDWVQWAAPGKKKSAFNPNAPILTEPLLQVMKQDRIVIGNLHKVFNSVLEFYGFEFIAEKKEVVKASNFAERSQEWMTNNNHNFLRLTRFLECFMSFGLKDEAQALFIALSKLHKEHSHVIGNSFDYWKQAVT